MTEAQRCDHWDICYFRCGQIGRCIEHDKLGCQFASHTTTPSAELVLDKLTEWREKRQKDFAIFVGDDWDAEWELIAELRTQRGREQE